MSAEGPGKLPVVAIIGRPNVGKSTLFNRLTHSRRALVHDQPGVTRDRLYGLAYASARQFLMIDTGGVSDGAETIEQAVRLQVEAALLEADVVLWILDAKDGLTAVDIEQARELRLTAEPVFLVINKAEGLDREVARLDFHELGMGSPVVISARTGAGIDSLWEVILGSVPVVPWVADRDSVVRIAFAGRPNVGKSTLVNACVGDDRVVVADEPGTTRDSVAVPMVFRAQSLVLIDTAGVRRKAKVRESLEKFSVAKTLQAVAEADAAVLVIDACEGLTEQDATIAGLICEQGRAMSLVINKMDSPDAGRRSDLERQIARVLPFLPPHRTRFVSAQRRQGIKRILADALEAVEAAGRSLSTAKINKTLNEAMERHAPPRHGGRLVRIKYGHQGGKNPPMLVLHGNLLEHLSVSYRRYLSNFFIKSFALVGTPLRIEVRVANNPYRS